jgi:hypothetical protein
LIAAASTGARCRAADEAADRKEVLGGGDNGRPAKEQQPEREEYGGRFVAADSSRFHVHIERWQTSRPEHVVA